MEVGMFPHQAIQEKKVAENLMKRERVKMEIQHIKMCLMRRIPGTIRDLKKELKAQKEILNDLVIHSGTLYNGGVW